MARSDVNASAPPESPAVWGLALWSMGIFLAQRVGLLMVATVLAALLDRSVTAVRVRLRDWYLDGPDKQGAKHGSKRGTLDCVLCGTYQKT